MTKKNNQGFAHLILLLILVIAVIGVFGLVFFKSAKLPVGLVEKEQETAKPTVAQTTSKGLEEDLNSSDLSDPSADFSEVDKDLESL